SRQRAPENSPNGTLAGQSPFTNTRPAKSWGAKSNTQTMRTTIAGTGKRPAPGAVGARTAASGVGSAAVLSFARADLGRAFSPVASWRRDPAPRREGINK